MARGGGPPAGLAAAVVAAAALWGASGPPGARASEVGDGGGNEGGALTAESNGTAAGGGAGAGSGGAGGVGPADGLALCEEPQKCVWPAWVPLVLPSGEFSGFKELEGWDHCLEWCATNQTATPEECCANCAEDAACDPPPEVGGGASGSGGAGGGLALANPLGGAAEEVPPADCPEGYAKGCDGWCIALAKLGDGVCDIEEKADLSCISYNYDEGDCVPPVGPDAWGVWDGGAFGQGWELVTNNDSSDPTSPAAELSYPAVGPQRVRGDVIWVQNLEPGAQITFFRTDEVLMAGNFSIVLEAYLAAPLAAAGQGEGGVGGSACARTISAFVAVPGDANEPATRHALPLADYAVAESSKAGEQEPAVGAGAGLRENEWVRVRLPVEAFNSSGMYAGPNTVFDRFGISNEPVEGAGNCELYLDALALEPQPGMVEPQGAGEAAQQGQPSPPPANPDGAGSEPASEDDGALVPPSPPTGAEQGADGGDVASPPDAAEAAAASPSDEDCATVPDEWPFCRELVAVHSCTDLNNNLTVLIALHCKTSCKVCSSTPPGGAPPGDGSGYFPPDGGNANSGSGEGGTSSSSTLVLGIGIGLISLSAFLLLITAVGVYRLRRRLRRDAVPGRARLERAPSDASTASQAMNLYAIDPAGVPGASPPPSVDPHHGKTAHRALAEAQGGSDGIRAFVNPAHALRPPVPPQPASAGAEGAATARGQDNSALASCQWIIPFDELRFIDRVGIGVQGEVFHAVWNGHTNVAVKRLFSTPPPAPQGDGAASGQQRQQGALATPAASSPSRGGVVAENDPWARLKNEVDLLVSLRHPNIVLFMGACEVAPNLCLVMEFCPRGSLDQLLAQGGRLGNGKLLDRRRRTRLALQAARGVAYLHSHNIIHRDLKPGNLLVTSNYDVKVADFGLSRFTPESVVSRASQVGTVGYMAPEILKSERYSTKCDVWSFGVVLYEILTGHSPYAHHENPVQCILAVACHDERPRLPEAMREDEAGMRLGRLCDACMQPDPSMRPSFLVIVEELQAVMSLLQPPLSARQNSARGLATGASNASMQWHEHQESAFTPRSMPTPSPEPATLAEQEARRAPPQEPQAPLELRYGEAPEQARASPMGGAITHENPVHSPLQRSRNEHAGGSVSVE